MSCSESSRDVANSLGVELVKVEALRAMRERPNNPDAVDLAMQGWAAVFRGFSKERLKDAIATFEHALALDPKNVSALTGLALFVVGARHKSLERRPARRHRSRGRNGRHRFGAST